MNDFKKILILGVVLIFVGTSVIPLADSTESLTDPPVNIGLDGILGDNGWFISCVTITFTVNGEVDYIMYKIDDGEWTTYTEPFEVCEDGEHMICWYYVDNEGNQSVVECMDFKIDKTPPTIELTWDAKNSKLIADVDDETSGVERVEFYLDNKLRETFTESPFEWEMLGIGRGHVVQAVVYDNAGNYGITHPPPPIPKTRVFGITRNPEFTEETVSFFAIIVVSNTFGSILRHLTFQNNYSGYIGERFIFAVFEYGPY